MQRSIGDVVRLKSGGPEMTVERIDDHGVACVWFDGDTILRATFPAQTVAKLPREGAASNRATVPQ